MEQDNFNSYTREELIAALRKLLADRELRRSRYAASGATLGRLLAQLFLGPSLWRSSSNLAEQVSSWQAGRREKAPLPEIVHAAGAALRRVIRVSVVGAVAGLLTQAAILYQLALLRQQNSLSTSALQLMQASFVAERKSILSELLWSDQDSPNPSELLKRARPRQDAAEELLHILRNEGNTPVQFTGIQIPGVSLRGVDLSGADLTAADLSYADLSGANLTGAHLAFANLTRTNLSNAELTNADFSRATLDGAALLHANISGATFSRARFRPLEAELLPIEATVTDTPSVILSAHGEPRVFLTSFEELLLRDNDFSGADLSGTIYWPDERPSTMRTDNDTIPPRFRPPRWWP